MDNPAVDLNKEVESQTLAIPAQAQALVIDSKESMTGADTFKKGIKALIGEIDSTFKPLANKAFAAHRAITEKWKATKQPLLNADQVITEKAKAYLRAEEKKRQEEERRLREIARLEEEERRLAEAIELEKEGNAEEAQEILEEPMQVVAPTVVADVPKVDKRMYRTTWKWRVTNMEKIPSEYFTLDERKISGVVRALKEATNILGVEVFED